MSRESGSYLFEKCSHGLNMISRLASILKASSRGDTYSYIIAPAGVHGRGRGPVGRTSGFTKFLDWLYSNAGYAFVVGEGTNMAGFVSRSDLFLAFLLIIFLYSRCTSPT